MASDPITSTIIAKWMVLGLWAALGGVTHTLVEKRKGKVKSFVDGLILSLISGFAGLMWGLIAVHFYPHDIIVVAFVSGLGGYMSLEGIAIGVNYLKKKFFIK